MKSTFHSCPHCNTSNTSVFVKASLMVCRNCSGIVLADSSISHTSPMPGDWSFIQLGTLIEYQKHQFEIVGRVRLQLRNDYKNFWCAALANGRSLWLMESFASFALLTSSWNVFTKDADYLKAGLWIKLKDDFKIKGEYVEKCEAIAFEGEICDWKLFRSGFYFVQASNNGSQTAVFTIADSSINYLSGKKIDSEHLKFKNTIQWDEWS